MKFLTKILMIIVLIHATIPQAFGEVVDGIAAVVNRKVITYSQIEEAERLFAAQGRLSAADSEETRREKVVEFLIENELVSQRAEEIGVLVNSDELDAALADIKQRNNLVSDEQLKAAVNQEGGTWDEFLEEIRRQIKVAKLMNREVRAQVEVTEEEIAAYYQDHAGEFDSVPPSAHIRQILLKVEKGASEAEIQNIQEKAVALVQELREGADFTTIAQQYSEHSSAESGGELGTFKEGDLAAPYDIAFTLEAGEISDPARSDLGFHIIYVEEKSGGAEASFNQAQNIIRRKLYEEKSIAQYKQWMDELKKLAYIEIKE